MDVTVVVATFGSREWSQLAEERAMPSAARLDVPVVHAHSTTLHGARNRGLTYVDTEWTCFLDADDELEPGYFDAMDKVDGTLRPPMVRYVRDGRAAAPRMPRVAGHRHPCTADCLPYGNWLVIGTVAPTALLRQVGGFRDFDWSEDWDLWVRCWHAGATITPTDAVYRAHVRPDSRNRGPEREFKHANHQAIARANGLPVPA